MQGVGGTEVGGNISRKSFLEGVEKLAEILGICIFILFTVIEYPQCASLVQGAGDIR